MASEMAIAEKQAIPERLIPAQHQNGAAV